MNWNVGMTVNIPFISVILSIIWFSKTKESSNFRKNSNNSKLKIKNKKELVKDKEMHMHRISLKYRVCRIRTNALNENKNEIMFAL